MVRPNIFRVFAAVAPDTIFIAVLAAKNRRFTAPRMLHVSPFSVPDDLSAELQQCRALGRQDVEEARCQAAWVENRRRFFDGLARPLPPVTGPITSSADAPGTPASPKGGAK